MEFFDIILRIILSIPLPYKAREVLARLQRAGFIEKRRSGSQTFRSILKQAKLTEEEFRKLWHARADLVSVYSGE